MEPYQNKDGTVTVCGIDFDMPDQNPSKWDYVKNGDGSKDLWVNTFERGKDFVARQSYKITLGKRGGVFFEDRSVKGVDAERIKALFGSVKS